MSATIELRLGDLFDGPADLIVLPCSTAGTITRFVAKRLHQYTIPDPRRGMRLGEVDFAPFTGAENIAQFVAFAASVLDISSNEAAIEAIGKSVGQFALENKEVQNVSAPLLGAGAGGLSSDAVVDSLSQGFRKSAPDTARLVIHIRDKQIFDQLMDAKSSAKVTSEKPDTPPRVFVSYSGTSENHKEWVAQLATFLRSNGVDARLDQWHLRNGMDLPQWMSNELELAERVIVICDARYKERADKRSGGVGWETKIIQFDMMQEQPDGRKYLIIVREDDFNEGIPKYLEGNFSLHWSSQKDESQLRDDLLKELYHVELAPPILVRPALYVV